jgi:sialic acid synthase SpsE
MDKGIKIIAEIGQNHNGCIEQAKQLVDYACNAGCYAVKSAKRDIASFPEEWKTKKYKNKNSFGKTYYDHRVALELSNDEYYELCSYTQSKGLLFGSSFTDKASLDYLCNINVDFLKIASSRVIDYPLLKATSKTYKPVILSTGMSNINNVEQALSILGSNLPYLTLMQCTSCYPTDLKDINLNVLKQYKKYGLPIGLSLHNPWYFAAIPALTLGAEWFEFHITTNRNNKGTDHSFSLVYPDFVAMRNLLYNVEETLGSENKHVLQCEEYYIKKLRDDLL